MDDPDTSDSDGGSAVPEAKTPADIEADIVRRRQELAAALDEIAVRVHPKTIADDAKSKVMAAVDRTAGRAYGTANRAVSQVRAQFVGTDGAPRMERVVPAAVVTVALVGGLCARSARRRRG